MANIAKSKLVTEGWAGLPPIAKGVILIGVGVGAFLLIRKIVKIPGKIEGEKEKRQEDRGWNKEFDEMNSNASTKPTMTKAQMMSMANKLENCMDGYGTRDYDIKQAFKENVKNNADFAGLSAAFGIREIEAGYGIGWISGGAFKGTMVECLNNDASSSTLDYINDLMKKRKIKYRV